MKIKKIVIMALTAMMFVNMICPQYVYANTGLERVINYTYFDEGDLSLQATETTSEIKLDDKHVQRIEQGYNLCVLFNTYSTTSSGGGAYKEIWVITYPAERDLLFDYKTKAVYEMAKGGEVYIGAALGDIYATEVSLTYYSTSLAKFGSSWSVVGKSSDLAEFSHVYDKSYCPYNITVNNVLFNSGDLYHINGSSATKSKALEGTNIIDTDYTITEWCEDKGLVEKVYNENYTYIANYDAATGTYFITEIEIKCTDGYYLFSYTEDNENYEIVLASRYAAELNVPYKYYYYSEEDAAWVCMDSGIYTGLCSANPVTTSCIVNDSYTLMYTNYDILASQNTAAAFFPKTLYVSDTGISGRDDIVVPTPVPDDGNNESGGNNTGGSNNGGTTGGGSEYFDTSVNWSDVDLKESVTGLVDMVGAVPTIIAGIFSFLPPWCLAVVGLGFSMVLILFVVKVIRG